MLGQMFQTKDDGYGFGPTSPHNFLLWALETLAWNRELLSRAALALARLVRLDPGAKDGNHPLDSLRQIFVIWYPNTTAPLASRTAILTRISKELPDVAWPLLLGLLPAHYGATCLHPHDPKWHGWKPDEPRAIPNAEVAQAVDFLVEQLLLHVGSSAARWCDLMERAGDLWPHHREKLLQTLETTDFRGLSSESALRVVGALRELVTSHEEFSDADWAMAEEHRVRFEAVTRRIEPLDPVLRHQWLFKGFVHLPERRELGWQEHEKEVARLRCEALREIIEVQGVYSVFRLAEQAEDPGMRGHHARPNRDARR